MTTFEYGLFSPRRNRFMLISDDHSRLKNIQMLLMQQELLYLVDLGGISNYRRGLFNNSRCMLAGIANGDRMWSEIDMYVTNPAYVIQKARPIEDQDRELQEKLLMLESLLICLEKSNQSLIDKESRQYQVIKKSLSEFKKFLSLMIPDDTEVQTLLDREIENKYTPVKSLDEIKKEVFNILFRMDYQKPINEIKKELTKKLSSIPTKYHYFPMVINELRKNLS
jgi:hypothetical protein